MVFTSPRVPYRPVLERSGEMEMVEIALTLEHCHALACGPRPMPRAGGTFQLRG